MNELVPKYPGSNAANSIRDGEEQLPGCAIRVLHIGRRNAAKGPCHLEEDFRHEMPRGITRRPRTGPRVRYSLGVVAEPAGSSAGFTTIEALGPIPSIYRHSVASSFRRECPADGDVKMFAGARERTRPDASEPASKRARKRRSPSDVEALLRPERSR